MPLLWYDIYLSKKYLYFPVYYNTIHNIQEMDTIYTFIHNIVNICNEVLLGHEMDKILSLSTVRMELKMLWLSDISQTQKDKKARRELRWNPNYVLWDYSRGKEKIEWVI